MHTQSSELFCCKNKNCRIIARREVVDFCIDVGTGVYLPEIKDFVIRKNVIERYTNIQRKISYPNSTPLREITIMFFICNEGISILENTGEFIPFPSRFKEILLQLRDKSDEQNDKKK